MCEPCEEEKRRVSIRQSLAWLEMADAVNAAFRRALTRQLALLDADPRPTDLWEQIAAIEAGCVAETQGLQSGFGQTRQ